jgi:hypothetical protein
MSEALKRVTVSDAPAFLNTNDKAFWAIGWNDCVESVEAELQQAREERTAWRVTAENAEAAAKQARIDALEEAKQACMNLVVGDSKFPTLRECNLNNTAVRDCAEAIESLKGKTL